ncbi:MAG TPA: ferritin family protein [Bacteroidales bacterium]|nr:ferritin family protein [Bacteroidales bacterium]HRZ76071.1 ferritin family protein [Bacteroidales bacterium]
MKEFSSIHDILEFAIRSEQAAVEFYTQLATQARNGDMKAVFEQFAREEMGHKARLLSIRESGFPGLGQEKVADLKIADYTVAAEVSPGMSYSDALVVAMKREKSAFRLYMDLSERAGDQEMKEAFLSLAMEESKHKLRFELEYDEFVLREN